MAEKVKKEPKARKDKTQGPGMGDNIAAVRKAAEPIVERLLALQKQMDSDMGGYKVDFKNLYEEGANAIGCKKGVLVREFKRILAAKRAEEKEQQMDKDERDQTESFRAAMGDTPFGRWASGKLAKAVKPAAD